MMAMAFNYLPITPQLKENFWGNFPYTTQLVRDCDTKYMYQTRGDLSSAQNLYARGLNQVNGACTNLKAGVGVKESFVSEYNDIAVNNNSPIGNAAQTIVEPEEDEKYTRENFSCLVGNNDGRSTLGSDYKPGSALNTFDYGNINPLSGQVPFNSCSGPVICRDRIMYSPARSRATSLADPIRGDIVTAGQPTVTWSSYAVNPGYGLNFMGQSGGAGNQQATITGLTNGNEFGQVVTGERFLERNQIAARTSLGRF